MTWTVTISHIDTCLSCYLQDHHNREGEKLLGVPVSRESTQQDVLDGLRAEWDQAELYEDIDAEVLEEIEARFDRALDELARTVPDRNKPFDEGLDPADSYKGEQAQAWFLVTYTEDEEDDEDAADAAVAVKRLAELSMNPKSTITGEELAARLDAWIGAASGGSPPPGFEHGFRSAGLADMDEIKCVVDGLECFAWTEADDCCDAPDERDAAFWPSLDPNDDGWLGPRATAADLEAAKARAKAIMQAWRDGEWDHCGVVVQVCKPDGEVLADPYDHALWGIERNYPGGNNAYLTETANELLAGALAAAREKLADRDEEKGAAHEPAPEAEPQADAWDRLKPPPAPADAWERIMRRKAADGREGTSGDGA